MSNNHSGKSSLPTGRDVRSCIGTACFSFGLVLFLAASPASAQGAGWAEKMFSATSHDFGMVARGADVRTRIKVTNIYKEDVRISNVRTSCGCSTASLPPQTLLRTHESTYIEVAMDTRRFTRHKDSNVLVTFDAPYVAEVRIPVKMYVRTDVVLTPGGVNFGTVELGKPATRTIDIAYAGRPDWAIREVRVAGSQLTAEAREMSRVGGTINYQLIVTMQPPVGVGTLREEIQLVTNDAANPTIPVLVEGRIEADITVTPETVALGTMTPGIAKTVNVVIRGRSPFAIDSIECEGTDDAFAVRLPQGEKQVHVLPLTCTPPDRPGPYTEVFTVTIAGRSEPITFKATGRIVSPTAAVLSPAP